MKKRFLLLAILLFGCAALTSCEKGTPIDEPTEDTKDKSLAGSMWVAHHITKAEGTYNDVALEAFKASKSRMHAAKVSDTAQKVEFSLRWGETWYIVYMPLVPLSGEPFIEARYDYTCTDATVTVNETKYKDVHTSIKGWVRHFYAESSALESPAPVFPTRYSPYKPEYTCDIKVECALDGKVLAFHLTDVLFPL